MTTITITSKRERNPRVGPVEFGTVNVLDPNGNADCVGHETKVFK